MIIGTVAVLLILIFFGSVLFIKNRFMPKKACDRKAILNGGGKIINIEGFNIWYKILNKAGKGVPTFVLPGGLGMASTYLQPSMDFLAEKGPLIYYDPRGCGRSQIKADLGNYKWSDFSKELDRLIEYIAPGKKVDIVCHSCGGVLGLKAMCDFPEKVNRIIFVSSLSTKYEATPPKISSFIRDIPPKDPEKANQWCTKFIKSEAMFGSMFYDKKNLEQLDTEYVTMAVMINLNTTINPPFDFSGKLNQNKIPALVICGNEKYESETTGKKYALKLCEEINGKEIIVFENSGHFCFIEENARFVKTVKRFLDFE